MSRHSSRVVSVECRETKVSTGIDGLRERVGEIEQPKNAWIEIARQADSEKEAGCAGCVLKERCERM